MANPLIQIDNEIREMTDEEYEYYLAEFPETVLAPKPTTKK